MTKAVKHPAFVLAADIGGTHITSAVVDMSCYTVLQETIVRKSLNSLGDAKSILQAWETAFRDSLSRFGADTLPIGIAMPGPFDYEQGISLIQGQNKYDALHGICVKDRLAEALDIPSDRIRMINDAAAFLQGEVFAGGHDKNDKVLGITLGTGLGSAVWKRENGSRDAALWDTPYQGRIMEEALATRWFVQQAERRIGVDVRGLKELLELPNHSTAVNGILDEYSKHLLHFLRLFSEQESCRTFIIGGNIAKAWTRIRENFDQQFNQFNIHISQLGEHAALVGAATVF